MKWTDPTPDLPKLKHLTPMEAHAIWGAFLKKLEKPELVHDLQHTGVPLEGLVATIKNLSDASKGGVLGQEESQARRLDIAPITLQKALDSEDATIKMLASALDSAIRETMPYVHVVSASRTT